MGAHMKTTVDLSDDLLAKVKLVATRERTTLRALLEEGLRLVLDKRSGSKAFHLRDASYKGKGVQPGVTEGDWDQLRDLIYEGRGA